MLTLHTLTTASLASSRHQSPPSLQSLSLSLPSPFPPQTRADPSKSRPKRHISRPGSSSSHKKIKADSSPLAAALTNTIKSAVEDYPVELESVWICVLNPLPELLRANVVPLLLGCSTASNGQIVETTLFRLYEFVRTDAEMRRTFSALGDRFDSPVAAIPTFVG